MTLIAVMKGHLAGVTVLSCVILVGSPAESAQRPRSVGLVRSCAACHQDTPDASAIPRIAGLPAEQNLSALREFRSGQRKASVMNRIARGFEDADLVEIARILSSPNTAATRPNRP